MQRYLILGCRVRCGMVRFTVRRARKVFNFVSFSVLFLLLSVFIRPKKGNKKIIGFASAQFSGNIKYLYLEMKKYPDAKVLFVTGEKEKIETAKQIGVDARYSMDFWSIPLFLRTHAWVTSHGSNYIPFFGWMRRILPFWKWKRNSKWIDVWHGLGWVHTERGKMLRNYDLAIDTSEFFKKYYSKGDPNIAAKIKLLGYPRNDPLVDGCWSREQIEKQLRIPIGRKNILYATTWGHKYEKKLFPSEDTTRFIMEVDEFCEKNNCNFLIRMHPNWYMRDVKQRNLLKIRLKNAKWVFHVSPYKYTDTQPLLYISDVLITDWSSIANDYILLNRPMIFLETRFPGEKFVLTPEDRAGYIAENKSEFFEALYESIMNPNLYEEKRRKKLEKLYKYINGNSAKRCAEEILKLIA